MSPDKMSINGLNTNLSPDKLLSTKGSIVEGTRKFLGSLRFSHQRLKRMSVVHRIEVWNAKRREVMKNYLASRRHTSDFYDTVDHDQFNGSFVASPGMSVPPSPESTIVASPDQLLLPYSPDSSILTTPQSPSEDMTLVTPKRAGITAADVSASRSLLSSGGRRRSVDADSALNVSSKLRGQMGRARPLSKEETLKKRKAVLSNRYDVRENRVKNFFKEVLMRHEMKVFQNRGISIEVLKKKNLGNFLNITKRTIKDLDFDVNQTAPALPSDPIQVGGVNIILRTITAADTDDLEPAIAAADLGVFENAERVVREEFAAKNVAADLSSVIHERFAVDLAIDIGTGEVAGAAEYVFMRKYLWLDAIATSKEARGCGVGTLLLDRLVAAARWRGKALLCFALNDVVDWYLARGFKVCNAFPREEWHIGQFLIMY